jgi:hypothetical protein
MHLDQKQKSASEVEILQCDSHPSCLNLEEDGAVVSQLGIFIQRLEAS